ncbi:putative Efflux transporter, RND family, MFP subunit [Desulfamplus magnetovallimortis]|uniref:Putative Efflux transporter, RND family, MFP subunit n=1 Tax=Desulfamplus magnetovallimortis TaxID=1246637 RepID=A0A1W1HA69_9BACT|nr:hypothetical protein [Desulfamplus magnetovallimortis]SLM29394.1 putative Efflux transporter, RND family, MFP subunit [Desulfamplus magnetovallimortis]
MKTAKKLLIVIPIVCGIMVFMYMKKNRTVPVRLDAKERIRTVRVISLEKMDVIPRATGYGYVEPAQSWDAISEVSGKVIEVHPYLKKGFFINKGERLLRIDTATYGLAESRGKAEVMNVDAQLKELEQSRENTRRLLEIEKRSLNISAQELERKRGLFKKGYISESEMENEEKRFLAQQTTVNNLQNSLDLFPAQRKALLARKDSGELTLTERQLDVAKTEIIAPFDCRLSLVNVELNQYAAPGSLLLRAESIHSVEIPVQITPQTFMTLLPKIDKSFMPGELSIETIRKAIGISALVRLPIQGKEITWQGLFSRTSESMDLTTGALTIFVTVDEPYGNVIPGKRPPLITNMYVEVELRGKSVPERYVVPSSAVHEGVETGNISNEEDMKVADEGSKNISRKVGEVGSSSVIYIADSKNRLKTRKVNVAYRIKDMAVLEQDFMGLEQGEFLVTSDLVPAIEGMLLNPVRDITTENKIKSEASGKTSEATEITPNASGITSTASGITSKISETASEADKKE